MRKEGPRSKDQTTPQDGVPTPLKQEALTTWTEEQLDAVTYKTNLSHGREGKKTELADLPALERALGDLAECISTDAKPSVEARARQEGSPTNIETVNIFDREVERIEAELGITFVDQNLLRAALTHKRASFPVKRESPDETPRFFTTHHANLETYGDLVLGEYVDNIITPRLAEEMGLEGQYLRNVQDMLNSNLYLSVIASNLKLDLALRMDPQMIADQRLVGEAKTGKGHIVSPGERRKRITGDPMEALVGAIFLNSQQSDGGESFKKFMDTFFYPKHPAEGGDQRLFDLVRLVGSPNTNEVVTVFDRLARGNASLKTNVGGKKKVAQRNKFGKPMEDKKTRQTVLVDAEETITADIRFDKSMYHSTEGVEDDEATKGDLILIGEYKKETYDKTKPEFIGRVAGRLFTDNTWMVTTKHNKPVNKLMPSSASEEYLKSQFGELFSSKGLPGERKFREKKIDGRRIFDIHKRSLSREQERKADRRMVEYFNTEEFKTAGPEEYEERIKQIITETQEGTNSDAPTRPTEAGSKKEEAVDQEKLREKIATQVFERWCEKFALNKKERAFVLEKLKEYTKSEKFKTILTAEIAQSTRAHLNSIN